MDYSHKSPNLTMPIFCVIFLLEIVAQLKKKSIEKKRRVETLAYVFFLLISHH